MSIDKKQVSSERQEPAPEGSHKLQGLGLRKGNSPVRAYYMYDCAANVAGATNFRAPHISVPHKRDACFRGEPAVGEDFRLAEHAVEYVMSGSNLRKYYVASVDCRYFAQLHAVHASAYEGQHAVAFGAYGDVLAFREHCACVSEYHFVGKFYFMCSQRHFTLC